MRLISVIFCMLLVSCAKVPTAYIPVLVRCPAPIIPNKIELPLKILNENSTPQEVISAYTKSVRLLIIDNSDLRARLHSYGRAEALK